MKKYDKVIVLGSGFPKALCDKMPVIKDLLDNIDEESLRRFVVAAKEKLKTDFDVENFISYVLSREIFFSAEEDIEFYALRKKLLKFIYDKMKDLDPDEEKMALMEKFLNYCVEESVVLITFNYDLFIEKICKHINEENPHSSKLTIDYGININKNPYSKKENLDGKCFPEHSLEILKLHGSFNWFNMSESESADIGDIVLSDEDEDASNNIYSESTPYYVPMSNTKYKYFAGNFYRVLWKKMNYYINHAETIDFIGYSFPKTDFDNLMLFSLHKDKVRNIVIYNSSDDMWNKRRLQNIFDRAKIHTNGAIDYLDSLLRCKK